MKTLNLVSNLFKFNKLQCSLPSLRGSPNEVRADEAIPSDARRLLHPSLRSGFAMTSVGVCFVASLLAMTILTAVLAAPAFAAGITIGSGASVTCSGAAAITTNGDITNNGAFSAGTGTVTLNGTNQAIAGTTASGFYNFSKTISGTGTGCTLTLPAGKTTTVSNTLTLQGRNSSNLLALRSSTAGSAASLTLPTGGTQSLYYLDVKDDNAAGGQQLIAYNSADSGSNTNWSFQLLGNITNGLVGHWKMDEASGSTAADSAGTNTGTATGTTVVAGKLSNARSFNGTSDYVSAADSANLDMGTNTHTVSAWINLNSYGSYRPVVAKRSGSSVDYNYHISDAVGDGKMASYNGSTSVGSTNAVSLNAWHHLVWVYNTGTVYFYLDGVANGSATQTSGAANNFSLYIGQDNGGTAFYHSGSIDDVRIYNRALTAAEIRDLYNYAGGSGVLALKDTGTASAARTNSTSVTASFTGLESDATAYALSNTAGTFGATTAITSTAFNTTWTLSTGDGTKTAYGRITQGANTYDVLDTITLDTAPPDAPSGLTLAANADKTAITASVTAPATSDVTELIWRYTAVNGNVAATYPTGPAAGAAFGSGSTTGIAPSSAQQKEATSLAQLKTYGVRVWAKDTANNISSTYASAFLYLGPPTPRLVITAPNNATYAVAGSSVTLTITAKDVSGNVITSYAGPYSLTWTPTGGTATTLVSSSESGWAAGVTTAAVTIGGANAGPGTFTATDNSTNSLTNGTLGWTFYPASFTVSAATGAQTAGRPFTVTVTALDSAGATVTRYAGAAALSVNYVSPASGSFGLSSSSISAASFISGIGAVSLSYPDAGTITITAKDTTYIAGVTIQGTSSNISFNPYAFTVVVPPPPGGRAVYYVGEPLTATVTAKNYNGAVTPNYRSITTFTSQAGITPPANYGFVAADAGTHLFSGITATMAGDYTVTAKDTVYTTITGLSPIVKAVNAKLVIPNISGPVGVLTGGCYILNADTSQVIAQDSSTVVNLTYTEAIANNTATMDKKLFTLAGGAAVFVVTDTDSEVVTVTATTIPALPVQSGAFTFGSSTVSNFRIEYNFEVTNYSAPLPVTTTVAPTTTTTTTSTYYVPPPVAYNPGSVYDSAVTTAAYQYSMAGTGGYTYAAPTTYTAPTSYTAPTATGAYSYTPTTGSYTYTAPSGIGQAQGPAPTSMFTAPSGVYTAPSGAFNAPTGNFAMPSGSFKDAGMAMSGMFMAPPTQGQGTYFGGFSAPSGKPAEGAMMAMPAGMNFGAPANMAQGAQTFAPGTFGQGFAPGGFAPGTFGPPAGMSFGPPAATGKEGAFFAAKPGESAMPFGGDFGAAMSNFAQGMPSMFGPPAGAAGGKEGAFDFGAMMASFGQPQGQGSMFGPPAGAEGGSQGFAPWMMGPSQGMPAEGMPAEGFDFGAMMAQYGPPPGMGDMFGPFPGMQGMPQEGQEEKKEATSAPVEGSTPAATAVPEQQAATEASETK